MIDVEQESALGSPTRMLSRKIELRGIPGGLDAGQTHRDNVPGTILRFLQKTTQILLCSAIVGRCACGRCWTRNSDHSQISCLGSDQASSVWTLSPSWWKACAKPKSGAKKLFVISMDVASAFDSVITKMLGDVLLERGATAFSVCGGSGERKPRSTVSGFHKECFVQSGRGHETRRPKNTFWSPGSSSVLGSGMETVRNFGVG